MFLSRIPPDTNVRPSSMPVFFKGGTDACLVIHGFTGYPGEMLYLGEKLNEAGYTVAIPRLPGHGTNTGDLRQTRGQDWLRRCTDTYLELAATHERVFICGLSLGGILAILLAGRFRPAGCVLYAPGIAVSNPLFFLTPLLKHFIRRLPTGYREESDDPDRLYLADEYWQWRYAKAVGEVYKLRKNAVKALKTVETDTLVFVSEADRTVPLKAADIIRERVGRNTSVDIIRLRESGHVLVNGSERETVARETIAWINERQTGKNGKE